MRTMTTKDGTLIYDKDWGSGQPMVFSHGWPLSADSWEARILRKTVLPVIAIALCVLLLLALSACGDSTSEAGVPLDRPASFTDKQWLGKQLFFDTNLSEPTGQACVACHASQVGWTGPDAVTNLGGAAYELSLIHISEPTRRTPISYAVFCLKKKKKN